MSQENIGSIGPWEHWNGDMLPEHRNLPSGLNPQDRVRIEMAYGGEEEGRASQFLWRKIPTRGNIVKYRILERWGRDDQVTQEQDDKWDSLDQLQDKATATSFFLEDINLLMEHQGRMSEDEIANFLLGMGEKYKLLFNELDDSIQTVFKEIKDGR